MLVPQRATPRWKEWIPLVSQQQRLRNLIQVHAFNIRWSPGSSFYFTLHLTTMSPPFYTSEHANHQHPRWGEMEVTTLESCVNTSATGVVIRIWRHQEDHHTDQIILVWGLHFSGLVYLGPQLNANAAQFNENAVVLHLQGGYFTDRCCLKELSNSALVRNLSVMLSLNEVKPSYSISMLLRLRNTQQAIKKQSQQSVVLRDKIVAGGVSRGESLARENNPTLRKLLNRTRPKPQQKKETLAARCQLEVLRFRVAVLRQEKLRKIAQVESLLKQADLAAIDNSDRSCELTTRYQTLHKETEQLRESRRQFAEMKEAFLLKSAQLSFRRKQLMTQLSLIYPVVQVDGKYTICGVHLPNAEDLMAADDVSVSVALGFVAHLVQMVSIFLQVPLRYPIVHFGSRSKVVDQITEKIPDKEREFPLFSRGKDKLQFHYGVYLLNKDISELRWLLGFPTNDLRATLHNVYHLLHLNQFSMLESHHRSMSGSSLDVIGSSTNVSPVGSMLSTHGSKHKGIVIPGQMHPRSRASNSVGSSEVLLRGSMKSNAYSGSPITQNTEPDGLINSGNLSYSLDKGLDEYEQKKKAEDSNSSSPVGIVISSTTTSSQLAHVGSEPNLVIHSNYNGSEAQLPEENSDTKFFQHWQRGSRVGLRYSDSNVDVSNLKELKNSSEQLFMKSEFTIVSERIAELVDSASSPLHSLDLQPAPASEEDAFGAPSVEAQTQEASEASSLIERSGLNFSTDPHSHCDSGTERGSESPILKSNVDEEQSGMTLSGSSGDIDIGTDALADIITTKISPCTEKGKIANEVVVGNNFQTNIPSAVKRFGSEENGMECVGVEESVLVENLFANVTSRTEALASSTTSFNLMSSRHGSS